jgi:predicted MFS family arabinose efflux permease
MGQLPYGSEAQTDGSAPELSSFSFREAIRTRQFWMIFTTYICFGTSQMGVMIHIVPHATDMGITPVAAANIMIVIGGFSVAGRIILGSIADRIGNKKTLIIGLSLMTLSLLLLQFANELRVIYLLAGIFGFSYGGEVALLSPLVAELFGLKALGAILGLATFAFAVGCAIGPLAAGSIFDMTGSYRTAFLIFTILIATGILLVSLIKRTHKSTA